MADSQRARSLTLLSPQFGWLLSYWNFSGVPFSYAYPAIYMATHDPATYRYPTWFISSLFVVLTAAYCVYDLSFHPFSPPSKD